MGVSNREGREDWFKRLKEYERENGMKLEEMVVTIVDMRRRDRQQKQLQEIRTKEDAEREDSDVVLEVSIEVVTETQRKKSFPDSAFPLMCRSRCIIVDLLGC